jgi:hypothetical protein
MQINVKIPNQYTIWKLLESPTHPSPPPLAKKTEKCVYSHNSHSFSIPKRRSFLAHYLHLGDNIPSKEAHASFVCLFVCFFGFDTSRDSASNPNQGGRWLSCLCFIFMKDKLLKSLQIIVISWLLWHKVKLFLEMLKFSKNCIFQRTFFLNRKNEELFEIFCFSNWKFQN